MLRRSRSIGEQQHAVHGDGRSSTRACLVGSAWTWRACADSTKAKINSSSGRARHGSPRFWIASFSLQFRFSRYLDNWDEVQLEIRSGSKSGGDEKTYPNFLRARARFARARARTKSCLMESTLNLNLCILILVVPRRSFGCRTLNGREKKRS